MGHKKPHSGFRGRLHTVPHYQILRFWPSTKKKKKKIDHEGGERGQVRSLKGMQTQPNHMGMAEDCARGGNSG